MELPGPSKPARKDDIVVKIPYEFVPCLKHTDRCIAKFAICKSEKDLVVHYPEHNEVMKSCTTCLIEASGYEKGKKVKDWSKAEKPVRSFVERLKKAHKTHFKDINAVCNTLVGVARREAPPRIYGIIVAKYGCDIAREVLNLHFELRHE